MIIARKEASLMEYRGIKINYVIIIIIMVLIIYFTGNFILNHYNVKKPLHTEITNLEGVEEIALKESNEITNLLITLNKSANLYQLYHKINDIAAAKLGKNMYEIVLNNKD